MLFGFITEKSVKEKEEAEANKNAIDKLEIEIKILNNFKERLQAHLAEKSEKNKSNITKSKKHGKVQHKPNCPMLNRSNEVYERYKSEHERLHKFSPSADEFESCTYRGDNLHCQRNINRIRHWRKEFHDKYCKPCIEENCTIDSCTLECQKRLVRRIKSDRDFRHRHNQIRDFLPQGNDAEKGNYWHQFF